MLIERSMASGRASCLLCHEKIEKGQCIVLKYSSNYGLTREYAHTNCLKLRVEALK